MSSRLDISTNESDLPCVTPHSEFRNLPTTIRALICTAYFLMRSWKALPALKIATLTPDLVCLLLSLDSRHTGIHEAQTSKNVYFGAQLPCCCCCCCCYNTSQQHQEQQNVLQSAAPHPRGGWNFSSGPPKCAGKLNQKVLFIVLSRRKYFNMSCFLLIMLKLGWNLINKIPSTTPSRSWLARRLTDQSAKTFHIITPAVLFGQVVKHLNVRRY